MTARFRVSSRNLMIPAAASTPNGAHREFPFAIADILEFDDSVVVRLEIPESRIYNENVFHVYLPLNTCWQVPARPHPVEYSPYIRVEKRQHIAVLFNKDGNIMELADRDVVQEYSTVTGPKYVVSDSQVKFPNGKVIVLPHPVVQVLDLVDVIVLRVAPPETVVYQENVMAFDPGGVLLWTVPNFPFITGTHRYVSMQVRDGLLQLGNTSGLELVLEPHTGQIKSEEVLP